MDPQSVGSVGAAMVMRISFAAACLTVCLKLYLAVKTENTTLTRELICGLLRGDIFFDLLIWPLVLLTLFSDVDVWRSYVANYCHHTANLLAEAAPEVEFWVAHQWAREQTTVLVQDIDSVQQAASELAVPAIRATAATTMAASVAVNAAAQTPGERHSPPVTTAQVEVFADKDADRQAWLRIARGDTLLVNQNRVTADGKSAFAFLGLGRRFRPVTGLTVSGVIGPQYTYERFKVDRLVAMLNAAVKKGRFSVLAANRLSWGLDGKPFASRHVQTVGLPRGPSWLKLNAEELRTPKGIRELFVGPVLEKRGKSWVFGVFPYRDLAAGRWDMRLDFAKTVTVQ